MLITFIERKATKAGNSGFQGFYEVGAHAYLPIRNRPNSTFLPLNKVVITLSMDVSNR